MTCLSQDLNPIQSVDLHRDPGPLGGRSTDWATAPWSKSWSNAPVQFFMALLHLFASRSLREAAHNPAGYESTITGSRGACPATVLLPLSNISLFHFSPIGEKWMNLRWKLFSFIKFSLTSKFFLSKYFQTKNVKIWWMDIFQIKFMTYSFILINVVHLRERNHWGMRWWPILSNLVILWAQLIQSKWLKKWEYLKNDSKTTWDCNETLFWQKMTWLHGQLNWLLIKRQSANRLFRP